MLLKDFLKNNEIYKFYNINKSNEEQFKLRTYYNTQKENLDLDQHVVVLKIHDLYIYEFDGLFVDEAIKILKSRTNFKEILYFFDGVLMGKHLPEN